MDYETFPAIADEGPFLDVSLSNAWQDLAGFGIPRPRHSDVFMYFRALGGIVEALQAAGAMNVVADIMLHVEYLAEKAGMASGRMLGGETFCTDHQIIVDALANIGFVLRAAVLARRPEPMVGVPADVLSLIVEAEAKLVGWCTREKALCIAETVLRERPLVCVEIGIFGGRSLIPCAAALRRNGLGVIYGIEAWSPAVAVQNPTNTVNDEWWSKIDFGKIKHEFYRFVADMDLTRQVRLVEAPSGRAAGLFDEIDFLHIDGSHSVVNAAEDVILYARKVRSGGIVIFDDVNWQSTAPARELLNALCEPVSVLKDPESGQEMCAVLRRR
jgi:predicted O-methyltransferase YrrM